MANRWNHKFLWCMSFVIFVSTNLFSGVPSGYYYFAKNKKQAELKTALHTYAAPMKLLDYGSGLGFTWEGFFYTDQKVNGSVMDMYSDSVRFFKGFTAVSGMHIEHSFPKSWWGAYNNNAYKDLFHLYPADGITNMTKSNLPLGEVTGTPTLNNGVSKVGQNGFGTVYTENCFEPADEFKGDFARSYFYISTIYQNLAPLWVSPMLNNNTYPVWKPWALDLLLKWHHQDPVSAKELARIEAVYNIQGNRNPFIDYPNLADFIWGKDTLSIYPFPEETQPFLIVPRRGTILDFGVILANDTRTKNIHIQGVNINSDITISLLKNNSTLTLSSKAITPNEVTTGIDLAITFTPKLSGIVRDTLIIQGGGLAETVRIPISALASADFITLEPTDITAVGGTLQWISDPLATDYQLSVYQGDLQAGDLIIATYVEGSSWNKAIELYNGTGKSIDLSHYTLQKQSNGSGLFGSSLKLSGMLPSNKSFVIVHPKASADMLAKAQLQTDSLLSFNGNDAVALLRSGVTIDMVGKANAGADVTWGLDLTLKRKAAVTHPLANFNEAEWETLPIDTYSFLGNHTISFASENTFLLQYKLTGKSTSFEMQNLIPQNTYTYRVEAIKPGGNTLAINTMQLHTSPLDAPVAMQATDIQSNSYMANWEETLYATGYLLNVFTISGKDTTEIEGFDKVGSSGTPLPLGWTGTASGNYTTTTSFGIATPSLGFKIKGEWLQTKTYAQPVSLFSFMYRFPTLVAASSLIVDGLSNGNWVRIDSILCKNSTKNYPAYSFTAAQDMKAFQLRFNKEGSGNLSVDDVQAKYGSVDTTTILKDKPISTTQNFVPNLKENTHYFYNVRAILGAATSVLSETIGVTTSLTNSILEIKSANVKIISNKERISIIGLFGDEQVSVYSLTGIPIFQGKAFAPIMDLNLKQNGIFIVRVQNRRYTFTTKVMK